MQIAINMIKWLLVIDFVEKKNITISLQIYKGPGMMNEEDFSPLRTGKGTDKHTQW